MTQADVDNHPDLIQKWHDEVIETSEATTADMIASFNCSMKFIWCMSPGALDGFIMANIREVSDAKIFSISCAAGAVDEHWDRISSEIERLAKACECTRVEIKTRPGLIRRMRKFGWDTVYTVIGKEL